MSSRKEQKEALRRERLERERQAKDAERRKRLVGYGAGGAFALVALVIVVVLLAAGGGGGGKKASANVYPDGGKAPKATALASDLGKAAAAAGCQLKSFPAKSREHTSNIHENIKYSSNPPTSGKHYEFPANDGIYDQAPAIDSLVHTMEHGRVIIWFKPTLPRSQRGDLKALYEEDTYQMVLVPDTTGMSYQVAATAWDRDPTPLGTGKLMACPRFNEKVFDALRAFRDVHRSRGPEPVP